MTVAFSLSMGAGGTPIDSRKLTLTIVALKGILFLAFLACRLLLYLCVEELRYVVSHLRPFKYFYGITFLLLEFISLLADCGLAFTHGIYFLTGRLWLSFYSWNLFLYWPIVA